MVRFEKEHFHAKASYNSEVFDQIVTMFCLMQALPHLALAEWDTKPDALAVSIYQDFVIPLLAVKSSKASKEATMGYLTSWKDEFSGGYGDRHRFHT